MLSSEELYSEFAPVVALWNDTPLSEPRAGGALLGDTPPQSLMAISQTRTMCSNLADVESD